MIVSPCALSTSFLRYWHNIHLHVMQSLLSAIQILRCTTHSTHVLTTENQHQEWPCVSMNVFYHELPFMGWKDGQGSAWEASDKHWRETRVVGKTLASLKISDSKKTSAFLFRDALGCEGDEKLGRGASGGANIHPTPPCLAFTSAAFWDTKWSMSLCPAL